MRQISDMRLYDEQNRRLYINPDERNRFIEATRHAKPHIRSLCLTLLYTGCRISEALELTTDSIQAEARLVCIRCLKKRQKHVIREVPVPSSLIKLLDDVHGIHHVQRTFSKKEFLWSNDGAPINRTTAYRWVKEVMEMAGIKGMHATAKGLRHGYGINAIRAGIQLHMLRKWMGHTCMSTTAIYATAIGKEELELAEQMW